MSELLPILFARGQNEGIDPRVAPPDVLRLAQNVRWRKDGRPAKRYGLTSISTSGFEQGLTQYLTQPVNAVTSWNGAPLFACGAGVAQRVGSNWGQHAPTGVTPIDLSHWGPGERSTITTPESYVLQNLSIGSNSDVVLFAWDDGTSLYIMARGVDGSTLRQPSVLSVGTSPRIVTTSSGGGRYLHIFYKSSGGLQLATFDTVLYSTTTTSVGALFSVDANFDAVGRSSDFLVVYQISATQARVKLYTGGASPTNTQQLIFTMASSVAAKMAIAGTSSSNIFAGYVQDTASGGRVGYTVFNSALTAQVLAPTVVETYTGNLDQPAFLVASATTAQMTWGGQDISSFLSYFRWTTVNTTGVAGPIVSHWGCRPASKPFSGPAFAALGTFDSNYVWVHTHDAAHTTWDTQRAYHLVQFGGTALRRQMTVPNISACAASTQNHLSEVIDLGINVRYWTALPNATRFGNVQNESIGAECITFRSIYESARQAARDTLTAGRVVQFSGGALAEWNGSLEETGFSNAPVITGVFASASGGLSAGDYIYVAVYEWLDAQGRRHRSAPSDPFLATVTASQKTTITVQTLIAESHITNTGNAAVLHIYRTLVGKGTFYRVTPNTGAPSASPNTTSATITYVDAMSDLAAVLNEIVYTDGGVLPNWTPPPCTFMAYCGGRVWLGGQLDRCVITASKWLVDGEPTQFTRSDTFNVFLPDKCAGLASLDGTLVAFTRDAIYLITGDGPNDQGIGQFSPPQALPTDVGCVDWRSVVETSMGVFFQSKRGVYLLPRGFGAPLFVGAEVEDVLRFFPIVVSANLVSIPSSSTQLGEVTVRFVAASDENIGSSATLVYDLRTGGWSVDVPTGATGYGVSGCWQDTYVSTKASPVSGAFNALMQEAIGTWTEDSLFIPTSLGTGDVRPFGPLGYGRFESVVLLGEHRGNCTVNVSVSVDGATADVYSFALTGGDDPEGGLALDVTPKVRNGSAIRVTVTDASSTGPSEGFIAQALVIEHETTGSTKRLATARRA